MIRPLLWLPLAALLPVSLALAQDGALEKQVHKLHALAGGTYCDPVEGGFVPEDAYMSWTFSYQPGWSDDAADQEEVTLVRVYCGSGAYNVQHAYYWVRDYEGLQPLAFAMPAFATQYAVENDIDSELLGVTVTGVTAATILVNSDFDPETLTVTSHSLWRGIGDASSGGTWVFEDGEFALRHYEIDASYDGEFNPQTVLDYPAPGQ